MAGTLYEKLGGYSVIAAVVDGLMARIADDTRLAKYFVGHGDNSKKRLRQMLVEMICQLTGGPCFYLGRDMLTVHKGMGINGSEWQVFITHLIGELDSFAVPDEEQKDLLKLLNSIKKDIVEAP